MVNHTWCCKWQKAEKNSRFSLLDNAANIILSMGKWKIRRKIIKYNRCLDLAAFLGNKESDIQLRSISCLEGQIKSIRVESFKENPNGSPLLIFAYYCAGCIDVYFHRSNEDKEKYATTISHLFHLWERIRISFYIYPYSKLREEMGPWASMHNITLLLVTRLCNWNL